MQIAINIDWIRAFCERYPIRRLALFGSALRDDFSDESNVDLLVEYVQGSTVTLLDIAQQEIELSDIFGRKVDLRTPNELSIYFRQNVMDTAVTLFR